MQYQPVAQHGENAFARVRRVLRAPGNALAEPLRAPAERRLGFDFAHVRVHHDAEAAASARALGAPAYAVGPHVVLAQPLAATPRAVLEHELAHVATVRDDSGAAPARIAPADAPAERAAGALAAGAARPAVVRAAPGTVHRFGSDEHKSLGAEASHDALTDVDIGTGGTPEYLTYGEMVALAGDYYGSLDEIRALARDPAGRLRIRWTKWWAIDQYHGVAEPALSEAVKTEVRNRYFTLAAGNVTHFSAGGTARQTYEGQHLEALHAAFMAGYNAAIPVGGGPSAPNTAPALTQEAFAQHFLSDMFAGGHVRTERSAIKAWYAAHMPGTKDQFVRYMAHSMHSYFVSEHPYASLAGSVFIPDEATIQGQIAQIGGPALDAFTLGDIVSLGYHDADNAGLHVVSDTDAAGASFAGGFQWVDVGDSHLASSPTTRGMAVAAMRASLHDVDAMVAAGHTGAAPVSAPGPGPEPAFQAALARLQPFAALRYVPRVDPLSTANLPMIWQWGSMNQWLYAAVDEAIKHDIADQLDTIAGRQSDAERRAGIKDFVAVLRTIGIRAIEQAVGSTAR